MNEISPLDQIDIIINDALEHDDPMIVFHQIRDLEQKRELIEAAKSKFFFTLDEVWDQFSVSRTESLYTQAETNLGLHPHTIDRHITMWKYQNALPEPLQKRPIREKFVITKMLSQGYTPSEDEWEKLERTNTKAEVDAAVRNIKGKEPRKGSLQLYLDNQGTLYGWGDGERVTIGYLDMNNPNPLTQKAIKRIMDSSGVLRK